MLLSETSWRPVYRRLSGRRAGLGQTLAGVLAREVLEFAEPWRLVWPIEKSERR
jgi:hypothetical protein